MNAERLHQLARAWRRYLLSRDALLVAAVVLFTAGVAGQFKAAHLLPVIAGVVVAALLLRMVLVRSPRVDAAQVARHLDRTFPELEESSTLWLRPPDSLTTVERLQRQRIDAAAQRLSAGGFGGPTVASLRWPFFFLIGAVVFCALSFAFRDEQRIAQPAPTLRTAAAPVWPQITKAEMVITPPVYTGRAERRVAGWNAEVEEGAAVTWSLALDQVVEQPRLTFAGRGDEALPLARAEDGSLRGDRTIAETALYQLKATLQDGTAWNPAEIHSLKVIKDRPPALQVLQPGAGRTVIPAGAEARAVVEVIASDDYAVTEAHLIATVAKGTGEAVKFREQKMAFDTTGPVAGEPHSLRLTTTLDLLALGLEPGDELYFHVEASDNRAPSPNHARSETRFLVFQGPEQSASTSGAGVSGINLVPEYFRSQRQIIIDTETLIAERTALPPREFQERANGLGIDQQLLRQRYAQFLGEEVEEDAPPEEHFHGDGHDHGPPGGGPPKTQEEVAAQFGHQHDSQDEATLFDRETKGTMRQVLGAMWEAERLLRMAKPEEALEPENRALEILKELQQADREYVQRIGFEATPLDVAGRRLRGDVSSVPQRRANEVAAAPEDEATPAIRELLRGWPWGRNLEPAEVHVLRQVEPALTSAAMEEPEKFLAALEELRQALAGGTLPAGGASKLKPALLRLLPAAQARPVLEGERAPSLAEPYYRQLEAAP
jgi:hypothetical protein